MTMNGRNVTLAQRNKIYGVRHKNFNVDRSMLSAAKCRPMILVARNIKHSLCRYSWGLHWRGGVKYNKCKLWTWVLRTYSMAYLY